MLFHQSLTIISIIPLVLAIPTIPAPTAIQSLTSPQILPTPISIPISNADSPKATIQISETLNFNAQDPPSSVVVNGKRAGIDDYLWMSSMMHVVEEGVQRGEKKGQEDGLLREEIKREEVSSTARKQEDQKVGKAEQLGRSEGDEEKKKGRTLIMSGSRSSRRRRNWRRRIHP